MRYCFALLTLCVASSALAQEPTFKQVEFESLDKVKITGDLYAPYADPKTPFLLLCHQAGWSRGEYREIAPRLNAIGFNCLAIDQRSGGEVNGVRNETNARVKAKGGAVQYVDARQDIVAALKHARATYAKGSLIALGSSYSSALVLQIGGTEDKLVDGVISFAPGEYFRNSRTYIRDGAAKLACPVFITSAKREHGSWKGIYAAISVKSKASFLPETAGNHGARALWKRFADSPAYWKALTAFLDTHFPRAAKK